MHDEAGFLTAIRQTPADDNTRLVFADWLDEQGDETSKTKAAFIRLELRVAEVPEKSLNRVRGTNALRKLATALDSAWLADISHPKLEACRMPSFRFECPNEWARLAPAAANVRHCKSCDRHVYFCDTLAGALTHVARGNCVALTPALVRKPNDLIPNVPPNGELVLLTSTTLRYFRLPLPIVDVAEPEFLLPVPPPVSRWVPEPSSEPIARQQRRRERRPRNIQRENWEEPE